MVPGLKHLLRSGGNLDFPNTRVTSPSNYRRLHSKTCNAKSVPRQNDRSNRIETFINAKNLGRGGKTRGGDGLL